MDRQEKLSVTIISGPVGVGKSTTSKAVARRIPGAVRIEGDHLLNMFQEQRMPSWEDRLRITWCNLMHLNRQFLAEGLHVVIDFVVEEEWEWLEKELAGLGIRVTYVVLTASPDTVKARIHQRGDLESLDRSMFLLHKLSHDPLHIPYLLDTDHKSTDDIADEIIARS